MQSKTNKNQIHGINLKKNINVNDIIDTEIVNIVDFGVFVKVHDEIDGMVHVSDLVGMKKLSKYTR